MAGPTLEQASFFEVEFPLSELVGLGSGSSRDASILTAQSQHYRTITNHHPHHRHCAESTFGTSAVVQCFLWNCFWLLCHPSWTVLWSYSYCWYLRQNSKPLLVFAIAVSIQLVQALLNPLFRHAGRENCRNQKQYQS